MNKYFVEYEFKTSSGNSYWFPIFLNYQNAIQAEVQAKSIGKAIEEHYKLIRRTNPRLIIDSLNGEFIDDYVSKRLRGKLAILECDIWRFKDVPTNPELNFEDHFEMVEHEGSISGETIAETTERHRFPVRLFYSSSGLGTNEYLLINVVDPFDIEDIHIVVEMDENDLDEKLRSLNEGIWKDSHISGYKVRVDVSHTPGGKRHVHIAHPKHTHSKNKQVSWNDDKTRHDKKTFDSNFSGMEKAKAIARLELGLKADAILECVTTNVSIILESVLDDNEHEIISLRLYPEETSESDIN